MPLPSLVDVESGFFSKGGGSQSEIFVNPYGLRLLLRNIVSNTEDGLLLRPSAGTAVAGTAPFKLSSGINNTIAEPGALEYNGVNLFFTRAGTTRENILCASAKTTEVLVSDTSVTVNIDGVTLKLLARA